MLPCVIVGDVAYVLDVASILNVPCVIELAIVNICILLLRKFYIFVVYLHFFRNEKNTGVVFEQIMRVI
jgi:hypothetical protein